MDINSITGDKVAQLYDIFIQAITLPLDKQTQYVIDACGGDPSLINEVTALLVNDHTAAENEWSQLIGHQFDSVSTQTTALAGSYFGAFRLESLLGQGGMGAVYLADRVDEQFEQKVAIKVINHQLEHVIGQHALIREASFMAKLNHPNIGKVFDAGVTPEGYSYIVMELVNGEPISTFWANKQVSIEDKLTVFCTLCDAIHHAHQNQIVHADLKPSNMLIDDNNHIKILDFGIARMFNHSGEQANPAYTTYLKALTPDYACPEVKLGALANTASDIFSLGKILIDLLNAHSTTANNIELNAIAEKAANVNSALRYPTVLDIKYDIDRFLNHQVVNAYPASRWYTFNKFVFKRYPIPALSAAAFIGVVTYLTANLYMQHQHLKVAKVQSDLVVDKLSQLLAMADLKKTNGKELLASDLLDNAAKLVKDDNMLNVDSLASIKLTLANSYESIGNISAAKILYLEVINSVGLLTDKDVAFQAGEQLVQHYLYSNEFSLIEPNTSILISHLSFSQVKDLPDTVIQAVFYHRYLNGMKYHLYQSMPSDMGQQHIDLLRNIKAHYWANLSEELKGNVQGALGGALENQIPIGIEFNFEQTDEATFNADFAPLIEEAAAALKQSIDIYTSLNSQIEVLKKQLVLGRAYIELDRFDEGRVVMDQAMINHQKILGEKHPNNIHFYKMKAGFYAYDAPNLSHQYAVKGVELAKEYQATNPTLYLNSLEVLLFTLYNTGQFEQYQIEANHLFSVYLALAEDKRDITTVTLAAKITDEYITLFGQLPDAINDVLLQINKDVAAFITDKPVIPDRTKEIFTPEFTIYLHSLANNNDLTSARIANLNSSRKSIYISKRAKYFYQKKRLELVYLQSEQDKLNHIVKVDYLIEMPAFIWGSKEQRLSVNRLDVLIKEAKIGLNYNQIKFAEQRLAQIKTLLDNRLQANQQQANSKLDNANVVLEDEWAKQYTQLVNDISIANQVVR